MSASLRVFAYVVLLGWGGITCLGQDRVASGRQGDVLDAPNSAAGTPTDNASGDRRKNTITLPRPRGMLFRPVGGVIHPDLDKAWSDYEVAIRKAADSMWSEIDSQFDSAVREGDLESAEKLRSLKIKLEEEGELPSEKEIKGAAIRVRSTFGRAAAALSAAYDAVTKDLTQARQIDDARLVRLERDALMQQQIVPGVGTADKKQPTRDRDERQSSHSEGDKARFRVHAALKQSLAGTAWGEASDPLVFQADGIVRVKSWEERGLITTWTVIDQRTVVLTITKGRSQDRVAVMTLNDAIDELRGISFHNLDPWNMKRIR